MEDFRYDIRPFQEGDQEAFLTLFHAAFHHHLPQHVWDWKYAPQPTGRRQIMTCFHENGEMIACFGFVPSVGMVGGAEGILKQGTDQMCHPQYPARTLSRRGFFVKTAEAFFEEFNDRDRPFLVYGFPGSRHFRLGEKLLHYVAMEMKADYLQKILSPKPWWKRWWGGARGYTIERITTFDERMDRLWQEVCADVGTGVARTASYYTHRYFSHPEHERYEAFALVDASGAWRAVGVLGVMGEVARVMDILVAREVALSAGVALVHDMLEAGRLRGASIASAWMPRGVIGWQILHEAGFASSPDPVDCVPTVVDTHSGLLETLGRAPLYYTMGDADIF